MRSRIQIEEVQHEEHVREDVSQLSEVQKGIMMDRCRMKKKVQEDVHSRG